MATREPNSVSESGDSNQTARLIDAFVRELDALGTGYIADLDIKSLGSVHAILELSRDQQVPIVLEAVGRQAECLRRSGKEFSFTHVLAFKTLISDLLRKNLPFRIDDLDRLIQLLSNYRSFYSWELSLGGILRVLENFFGGGVPDTLRLRLTALGDRWGGNYTCAAERDAAKRLDQLLNPRPAAAAASFLLPSDEAWTRYLHGQLDGMESTVQATWQALLLHCKTAGQSKPSRKWLQRAEALIAQTGPAAFAAVLKGALGEIGQPGAPHARQVGSQSFPLDPTMIHDATSDLLRGLVWCASLVKDDGLTTAVGDASVVCFKKIPNFGPRAPKIGNACLYALAAMSSPAAVGQLSRLKTRVKHASIRKQLAKALEVAADNTGMTAAEMEEVAVPSCGFTEIGARRLQLGDVTGVLEIAGGLKAELSWLGADGKKVKSVPASVKEAFADDLKLLKASEKEIAKLLPGQRDRLEQLLLQERTWSFAQFRSRYLDHPLVGTLARRLIWRYSDGAIARDGIWRDGQIFDQHDQPLDRLGDESQVAAWHPMLCEPEQVRAWRDWLDRNGAVQPFKQAHREIYILTDAERGTEVYSNRFAAHVIRQHQFSALCQQRGWRYTLQGNWDSYNIPTLHLPQCDLRAEFWVHAPENEEETAASGVYLHLVTDQVRFYRLGEREPMRLADVPPLVLSEVFRDVDLFVGVTSLGNDPNWSDGGPGGRYRDYWQSYSFGDLSATAQTRKVVLERIVPRLKIAERCTLADKFLTVRGDLRSFKIHLGSGNILMSPHDQYLCIVPKPSGSAAHGKILLPFEGDNMLSIILSKAFLLAEDSKIKDPAIVSQIRMR